MLNNPFCYTPSPRIAEAAHALIARINATPSLHALFAEGKMLGVLEVEIPDQVGDDDFVIPGLTDCVMPDLTGHLFLYGFSGLAGGSAFIDGFVPPIFAWKPEDIIGSSPEESRRLQEWLFDQYVVLNGRGERRSIRQIFADRGLVPPGGTGDCAAPKLLQYALSHGLKPLAIGEFWYGASPAREVRRHGAFYPACTGKCGPLLTYMMQGLDVEPNPLESDAHWLLSEPVVRYEDTAIVVVEKPAGMLAVPGRPVPGIPPRRSLQDWLSDYCVQSSESWPSDTHREGQVLACHRLDMDTSGLMVFAKTPEAQAALQQQFERREVSKAYLATVMADSAMDPALPSGTTLREGARGKISLPLAPDWYDRPRQMVDLQGGKPAVTEYEVLHVKATGEALLRLIPYTGRTHQLRVHCAHAAGLGRPILGDRLYGGPPANRLMLHAAYLSFRHPADGRRMTFESPMTFTD
ncbi:MAG: RluA family pseudouridine synthase [Bacteroidales bacterium]|nr:RluA family pseudouridine synthase [Bacteroidales bacterium]